MASSAFYSTGEQVRAGDRVTVAKPGRDEYFATVSEAPGLPGGPLRVYVVAEDKSIRPKSGVGSWLVDLSWLRLS